MEKNYVYFPGRSSSAKTVTCGCSTRSSIRSCTFSLYKWSTEWFIRHFADDTNDKKLDTIEKKIESVINHELNTSNNK